MFILGPVPSCWHTWELPPSCCSERLVSSATAADELYVATDGKDTNSGTKAEPFATLARARDEIRRVRPKDGATVFVREGTYYTDPDAMLYRHRNLDFETTESDYNLFHYFGKPLVMTFKDVPPEKQWEEWTKLGFEEHSVIADPLFVDPKNDDYRLEPDSPALELGFKPIPVEKIGPYESPLRASWPIVEAEGVREHSLRLDVLPKPQPRN